MSDTKLSALSAASAISGSDLFYVVQSATSLKGTGTQLKDWVLASPVTITSASSSEVRLTNSSGSGRIWGLNSYNDGTLYLTDYTAGSDRWQWSTAGHFLPSTTGTYDIGSSSLAVRNLFGRRTSGQLVNIGATSSTGYGEIAILNDQNAVSTNSMNFGYTGSAYAGFGGLAGEFGYFGTNGNFPFTIFTNSTIRMTTLGDGKIGFGTVTPDSNLTLKSTHKLTWDNGAGTSDSGIARYDTETIKVIRDSSGNTGDLLARAGYFNGDTPGGTLVGQGPGGNLISQWISSGTNCFNRFTSSTGFGEYGIWTDSLYFQTADNLANGIQLIEGDSGTPSTGGGIWLKPKSGNYAIVVGGLKVGEAAAILRSTVTITGGSTGNVPTLTAGPVTGNPTKWLPYDDNGTTRYIPAW